MRLVHLLVEPDLKAAFLAAESLQGRSMDSDDNRSFWQLAATKFNDDAWEPQHLFPTDPHLARSSAFTPSKKSKEVCELLDGSSLKSYNVSCVESIGLTLLRTRGVQVDPSYLREKYRALKKHFNISVARWNEMCTGHDNTSEAPQPIEAFWKCSVRRVYACAVPSIERLRRWILSVHDQKGLFAGHT